MTSIVEQTNLSTPGGIHVTSPAEINDQIRCGKSIAWWLKIRDFMLALEILLHWKNIIVKSTSGVDKEIALVRWVEVLGCTGNIIDSFLKMDDGTSFTHFTNYWRNQLISKFSSPEQGCSIHYFNRSTCCKAECPASKYDLTFRGIECLEFHRSRLDSIRVCSLANPEYYHASHRSHSWATHFSMSAIQQLRALLHPTRPLEKDKDKSISKHHLKKHCSSNGSLT